MVVNTSAKTKAMRFPTADWTGSVNSRVTSASSTRRSPPITATQNAAHRAEVMARSRPRWR